MVSTTIKVLTQTRDELNKFRESKNESYDEVIRKLVFVANTCKKDPELGKEAVEAIEKARQRVAKGLFVTETDAKKRLGL
ncbi:Uncharacterised protein [uncultured archaeon]|nr:Uncharacterised protein [uncultured archaeon]